MIIRRAGVPFDEYTIYAPLIVHVNVKSQIIRDARYISSGDAFCRSEKQVGRLADNCRRESKRLCCSWKIINSMKNGSWSKDVKRMIYIYCLYNIEQYMEIIRALAFFFNNSRAKYRYPQLITDDIIHITRVLLISIISYEIR